MMPCGGKVVALPAALESNSIAIGLEKRMEAGRGIGSVTLSLFLPDYLAEA